MPSLLSRPAHRRSRTRNQTVFGAKLTIENRNRENMNAYLDSPFLRGKIFKRNPPSAGRNLTSLANHVTCQLYQRIYTLAITRLQYPVADTGDFYNQDLKGSVFRELRSLYLCPTIHAFAFEDPLIRFNPPCLQRLLLTKKILNYARGTPGDMTKPTQKCLFKRRQDDELCLR